VQRKTSLNFVYARHNELLDVAGLPRLPQLKVVYRLIFSARTALRCKTLHCFSTVRHYIVLSWATVRHCTALRSHTVLYLLQRDTRLRCTVLYSPSYIMLHKAATTSHTRFTCIRCHLHYADVTSTSISMCSIRMSTFATSPQYCYHVQ
jgi:hypothetical protein